MAAPRPNILMIMTDQQRRDALGAYGCDWISTPNLDRLAASGVRFTRCTVDSPLCTPSRASIFTGKSVAGHSVFRVHDNLPEDEVLFVDRLRREAGYRTGLFGKLHVSSRLREECYRHPNDGFEVYEWCLEASVGMDSRFNGYVAWLRRNAPAFLAALRRNGRHELHHDEAVHLTKWAADRTIEFIADRGDSRPFFCLMSIFDPHDPYEDYPLSAHALVDAARMPEPIPAGPAPAAVERERQGSYLGRATDFSADEIRTIRHGYGASIAFADRQIGRVLAALEASGQAQDTLVIFMSDHGDQLGDHGLLVKGVALYEPTVGVPLILSWPDRLAPGGQCGALAQGHDVAATCLAAAGLDPSVAPESEDLVGMIETGRARRPAAICAYRNSGIDKDGGFWDPPLHSTLARDERHKLILYASGDETEMALFDLDADPGEQRNAIADPGHAGPREKLTAALAEHLQGEAALALPRFPPSIPGAGQRLRNALK